MGDKKNQTPNLDEPNVRFTNVSLAYAYDQLMFSLRDSSILQLLKTYGWGSDNETKSVRNRFFDLANREEQNGKKATNL